MNNIIKFPYNACRRVHSRKHRRSKNGTPQERAAKAAPQELSEDIALTLIKQKREIDIEHGKAIDAEDEANVQYGSGSVSACEAAERCAALCDRVNDIDWKLARTAPATLEGVAAALRFANQIEDEGMEWPDTDTIGRDGWHYQLRASMAQAIEAILSKKDKAAAASVMEMMKLLRTHIAREFSEGKNVDQIFDSMEETLSGQVREIQEDRQ
jgi:hypothetical protein